MGYICNTFNRKLCVILKLFSALCKPGKFIMGLKNSACVSLNGTRKDRKSCRNMLYKKVTSHQKSSIYYLHELEDECVLEHLTSLHWIQKYTEKETQDTLSDHMR